MPVKPHARPDDLSWNQQFARWSTSASKIDPNFPGRPDAAQVDAEYTPERVTRLAAYIAGKRNANLNPEQLEEDVAECIALIYERIKWYKEGSAHIPESYPFYHWLLFNVRSALRDLRDRTQAPSVRTVHFSTLHEHGKPDFVDNDAGDSQDAVDAKIDVERALKKLTLRQRQVIKMYYLSHMTQTEIARELKLSQPRVAVILAAAKERLAQHLDPESLA